MKILVAYDGSGYSRNSLVDLQHAGIPSETEVEILLLSISETWMPPNIKRENLGLVTDGDVAEYLKQYYAQLDRSLTETEEIALEAQENLHKNFPHWRITTATAIGSPVEAILSRASEFTPDLIVAGPRGLSSNGIGNLGSIAQGLLTEANCSVRIARGKTDTEPSRLKIFIGFNNTPGSLEAVKDVSTRRWLGEPEVRLVIITAPLYPIIPGHAFELIPGWSYETVDRGEQKWTASIAAEALQILNDAGLSAKLYVYSGNPRIVLVREGETWGADLVFVGANSFPENQFPSLGCVASAVAARASCTVEVIRKRPAYSAPSLSA